MIHESTSHGTSGCPNEFHLITVENFLEGDVDAVVDLTDLMKE